MKEKKRWLPEWWPRPTLEDPFPKPSEEAKRKLGAVGLIIMGILLVAYSLHKFGIF